MIFFHPERVAAIMILPPNYRWPGCLWQITGMFPIARDIRYPREIHDRTQKEKSDYKKRGKKKRVEEKANAAFGPLFSSTASTTGGVTGRFHPPQNV